MTCEGTHNSPQQVLLQTLQCLSHWHAAHNASARTETVSMHTDLADYASVAVFTWASVLLAEKSPCTVSVIAFLHMLSPVAAYS
jgi:hypothetical protein